MQERICAASESAFFFPDANLGLSSQRADADALLTDFHLSRNSTERLRKRESSVAGPHDTQAFQTAHKITTRLLYTFKLEPSISPAATYSPDPQTRSIKDGRPKPTVYGSPSYGARWDPEATPLRADRGSQPSASGARVRDSRQWKLRHSASRYTGAVPDSPPPPVHDDLGATADGGPIEALHRLGQGVKSSPEATPPPCAP